MAHTILHHHHHYDPHIDQDTIRLIHSMADRLDRIEAMLKHLIKTQKEMKMTLEAELLEQVTAIDNVKDAIVTFVGSQNARLDDLQAQLTEALKGNPQGQEMVTEAIARLKVDAEEMTAAIVANTDAATT